jgi:hypothetical protein
MFVLLNKLTALCDKYLTEKENAQEFLDKFILGLKAYAKGNFSFMNECFNRSQNSMTDEDKMMPKKITKDINSLKNIFQHLLNKELKTFDGDLLIKVMSDIQSSIDSKLEINDSPKGDIKTKREDKKVTDFSEIVAKKLTEKPNREEPEEINIASAGKKLQKILDDYVSNLSSHISSKLNENSFKKQLYKLQYVIHDYDQFEAESKRFKTDLDTVLDPQSENIIAFAKIYKKVHASTENPRAKVKTELHAKDPLLNSLIYSKLPDTFKPSDEEKNKVNENYIVIDQFNYNLRDKENNLLELISLFIKAHYYYEIKKIALDRLAEGSLSFLESKKLRNYFFGDSADSFDPENIYVFRNADPRLLNKNGKRLKLTQKLFGLKSISKYLSAEQLRMAYIIGDLFGIDMSNLDRGQTQYKALISISLIISLLTFSSVVVKRCGPGGSNGEEGEGGDGVERNRQSVIIEKIPGLVDKTPQPKIDRPAKPNKKDGKPGRPGKRGQGTGNGKGDKNGDGNGVINFGDGNI